ncbi:MAG TPA: hypothetical protein VJ483_10010 [Holophagaceae bacterium]|nr:hypothetical protein [Holophagaceae bacterium]
MTVDRPTLDTALRQSLQPGPAPEALKATLLREARRRDHPRRPWLWMGAAAAVLLGVGLWWQVAGSAAPSGPRLAQAALSDFVQAHTLDFDGDPPQAVPPCPDPCLAWSRTTLGFEAPLPREAAGCALQGGRVSRIKGQRAACYLLKDGRCVFVFEKPIPKVGPGPNVVLASAAGFQARAWNEGDHGQVMIEPMRP